MKNLALGLLIILLASPVSAGCAWVLWKTETIDEKGTYYLDRLEAFTAHETKAKCEAEMIRLLESDAGKLGRFAIRCLPDTVDPRPRTKSN